MSLYDDSCCDEDWDLEEDEDIALVLMLDKNRRAKYDGSIIGRVKLRRFWENDDNKLMRNYFGPTPVFPERYFRCWFRTSIDLLHHIANSVKQEKLMRAFLDVAQKYIYYLYFCVLFYIISWSSQIFSCLQYIICRTKQFFVP